MDGTTRATSAESASERPSGTGHPAPYTDGKARMKAWLANLPPHLAKIYQDAKRLDPKGQRRT